MLMSEYVYNPLEHPPICCQCHEDILTPPNVIAGDRANPLCDKCFMERIDPKIGLGGPHPEDYDSVVDEHCAECGCLIGSSHGITIGGKTIVLCDGCYYEGREDDRDDFAEDADFEPPVPPGEKCPGCGERFEPASGFQKMCDECNLEIIE